MENRKLSVGAIASLILTSLFIVFLILVTFLFSAEKFVISGSIVILLCLLIVLVLSNSFNNFSIGKLISFSREIDESKDKIKSLEKEKNEILLKVINVTSQLSSTTVNIDSQKFNKKEIVEDMAPDEISKKQEEETQEIRQDGGAPHRRIDNDKFEMMILKKFYGTSKYGELKRDVKVVQEFQDIDLISNKPVYFDAYIKERDAEVFVEIKSNPRLIYMFHDRLYVQLNKILSYKNMKGNVAQLLLLVGKCEKDDQNNRFIETLKRVFEPAQKSGLLRIEFVEFTETEYLSCLRDD